MRLPAAATRLNYSILQEIDVTKAQTMVPLQNTTMN